MNILDRFNTWYDALKEPYRFLFALLIIGVPFNIVLAFPFPTWLRLLIVTPVLTLVLYRMWQSTKK